MLHYSLCLDVQWHRLTPSCSPALGDIVFAILWPALLIFLGLCMCNVGENR